MCGIAGIWRFGGEVRPSEVIRMSDLIAHRGPDDAGQVLIDTRGVGAIKVLDSEQVTAPGCDLALANRRLAIIDLSSDGHQPMTWSGCTITYNGEVYNYIEIRRELELLNHQFRSACDTEVLLHAYVEWGAECLVRLEGMFAFAVWDSGRRALFCARDRLGIKPFYYTTTDRTLIFASEIRCILAALPLRPVPNEGIVHDFLTSEMLDHTTETFFRGIQRLPAGCFMLATGQGIKTGRYWSLSAEPQSQTAFEENVNRFRELFSDSVRHRMRSDVAVGSCLSGGMDSTALVCVASPLTPYRMRTFTARYRDSTMDEWRFVQSVAEVSPIDTMGVFAEPRGFWEECEEVVRSQEEPFGGPSVYAQWNLMRAIGTNGIRVVLDGQGGDELLCGYAKYFYDSLRELWIQRHPGRLAMTLARSAMNVGAHHLDITAARRYIPGRSGQFGRHLLLPGIWRRYEDRNLTYPSWNVSSRQILDFSRYSIPALLRFEDKNSMAFSVEARVPYLDHRLVEFAVSLPTSHKLYGAQSKRILRQALGGVMPKAVLSRRTKLGFGGSFRSWLEELTPQFDEWSRCRALPIDRYVRRSALQELVRTHDRRLFGILSLNHWLRCYGYES
jgi:asparagine synthase (glutamine-hydrolysing)